MTNDSLIKSIVLHSFLLWISVLIILLTPYLIDSYTNYQNMKSGKIKHVLINIAMEAEAKPFVEHLNLKIQEDFFPEEVPFIAYVGTHEGTEIVVASNGKDTVYGTNADNICTIPASMIVLLSLQKMKHIDIVINAGTCGGFKRKGAEIGDVYLTSGVAFHDRRIPIPGFDTYGIGKIDTVFDISNMANNLGYKTGICSTGNSLDKTNECDEIMISNDASVKDMEAGAIAYTCKLYKTPFFAIKVVTDIVDGNIATQDEFLENLHTASISLQNALPKVLQYVEGKSYNDL